MSQIFAGFIQIYHKKKGHRSSGLFLVFWFLLATCSIPQLRWEVNNFNTGNFGNDEMTWEGFQFIFFVTFFSLTSVMVLLNCFSDKPPRHSSYPKYQNPNPELKASIMNRIFFGYFDRTTWVGWRRPLTETDIFDINPENASREQVPVFDKHFQRTLDKERRSGRFNIKNLQIQILNFQEAAKLAINLKDTKCRQQ